MKNDELRKVLRAVHFCAATDLSADDVRTACGLNRMNVVTTKNPALVNCKACKKAQ